MKFTPGDKGITKQLPANAKPVNNRGAKINLQKKRNA